MPTKKSTPAEPAGVTARTYPNTDVDYTPETSRRYAREAEAEGEHALLYAGEGSRQRTDVLLFGGHVDPTPAERKQLVSEEHNRNHVQSLEIEGRLVTLGQLERLAETLAALIAEVRKWEAS